MAIRYGDRTRVSTQVQSWLPAGLFSPLELAPKAWYDASDTSTITESGGAVSQWNDKSGSGFHVSQATAASQPTTGSFTLGGLNVIRFDGGDVLAGSTASDWTFITSGSISIIVLCTQTGANGVYRPILGNKREGQADRGIQFAGDRSTNLGLVQTFNGSAFMYLSGFSRIAQNKPTILSSVHDMSAATAGKAKVFLDRAEVQTDNASTGATSSTAPTYAMRIGAEPTTYFFTGDIAEVLFFDRAITQTERFKINDYLRLKWSL